MSVLALAGGVGGAKLCLGLSRVLEPNDLSIIVNTGDDETFYGLHVSPDLDTVMYTLAGLSNPETGWGIAGETFAALESLGRLGEDTWFGLGDRDLATHIVRTKLLGQGTTLSEVTAHLSSRLGVRHPIAPMSDDRVRTVVETDGGTLPFQTYFVKLRCEPAAAAIRYEGADAAKPSKAFKTALESAGVLVYCPSNPVLSLAPILAIPGVELAIRDFAGTRAAVSPIVGGKAIRGPAAKLMAELGEDATCVGVARRYAGICDLFVIDEIDRAHAAEVRALGIDVAIMDTIMNDDDDKTALARNVLDAVGYPNVR